MFIALRLLFTDKTHQDYGFILGLNSFIDEIAACLGGNGTCNRYRVFIKTQDR